MISVALKHTGNTNGTISSQTPVAPLGKTRHSLSILKAIASIITLWSIGRGSQILKEQYGCLPIQFLVC